MDDRITPRKQFTSIISKEETPPPKKEKFSTLLLEEEKEEDEKEPLFDGPCSAPLNPSISGTTSTPSVKPVPSWAVEMVSSIVEPLRSTIEKGITKIEVTVHSKELSTIRILIDHYDTAPHSFNIELQGTEIAQRLFTKNQAVLEKLLKITLPSFTCNFLPPTFSSKQTTKEEKRKKELVKSSDFGYLPEIEV